jgi:hypothetical protein
MTYRLHPLIGFRGEPFIGLRVCHLAGLYQIRQIASQFTQHLLAAGIKAGLHRNHLGILRPGRDIPADERNLERTQKRVNAKTLPLLR